MKEEDQGDRSSAANYQIRSDLNVEFAKGIWDDQRIIYEMVSTAFDLVGESRRILNRKRIEQLAGRNVLLILRHLNPIHKGK